MKFSLKSITARKMTNLQNNVRRLITIALSLSYDAYHQSLTFKLLRLPKNFNKPDYELKDWQLAKNF